MNSGTLLLTSTGLSSQPIAEKFKALASNYKNSTVAIVTTATEEKESNKYSQLAKKQFNEMGFSHIDFVDLETEPSNDFSKYKIVYVCGGNTFKLLKFSHQANFKVSIKNLLDRNGIYIGVSAGSIIVGPTIKIAGEIEPDENKVGLKDLTGFGITDLIILPHYSSRIEEETKAFEKKHHIVVERLNNNQAILLQDKKKIIIS